jgi:pimeloyl-ACP methyl ester carboxylesterase
MRSKGCESNTVRRHQPGFGVAARLIPLLAAMALILLLNHPAAAQFPSAKRRPEPGPSPKNVHGLVTDARGKPIAGAHVFVKDMKTNVIRTLTTDDQGIYQVYALPPSVDYEVQAEFKGKMSEKRNISSYLNRQDNVLNFQLDVAVVDAGGAMTEDEPGDAEFKSYDLVQLHGSFDLPQGVPAPIPSVLLLHGYGEDQTVWEGFKRQLLDRGWAVLALDLRGHGRSTSKDGIPIQASPAWRNDPHQFPQDLDPALDFLKAQPRIDNRKIVVVGYDIGADLALVASGRFPEVRTVVALDPKFSESLALAGSAQDFTPRSALIFAPDQAEAKKFEPVLKQPYDIQTKGVAGGTAAWMSTRFVTDAIFQWLQKTY